jgi:hypothetical protein
MDAAPDVKLHFELPYSRWRIFLGYLAASVTSFFLSLFLMMASGSVIEAMSEGAWPSARAYAQFFGLLSTPASIAFAVVGIPIAAIVVGAIGMPVWQWFASRGRTSFADAALAGATAGAIIGVIELFVILVFALFAIADTGSGVFEPTTAGTLPGVAAHWNWIKVFLDIAHTIGIGAVCGLIVRAVAGPPKRSQSDV